MKKAITTKIFVALRQSRITANEQGRNIEGASQSLDGINSRGPLRKTVVANN